MKRTHEHEPDAPEKRPKTWRDHLQTYIDPAYYGCLAPHRDLDQQDADRIGQIVTEQSQRYTVLNQHPAVLRGVLTTAPPFLTNQSTVTLVAQMVGNAYKNPARLRLSKTSALPLRDTPTFVTFVSIQAAYTALAEPAVRELDCSITLAETYKPTSLTKTLASLRSTAASAADLMRAHTSVENKWAALALCPTLSLLFTWTSLPGDLLQHIAATMIQAQIAHQQRALTTLFEPLNSMRTKQQSCQILANYWRLDQSCHQPE